METKYLNVPLQIKQLNKRQFEGHGSVFGNVDLGGDVVVPGAFKRSLAEHKEAGALPQMFWMHDMRNVPGMWLEMGEDETGLAVKGELLETPLGNEMHTLINAKAIRGLSIGYQIVDADFDNDGNRLLKEIDLWEVSLVSLAMNPLAQVESAKVIEAKRDFEAYLREAGASRSVAKAVTGRVFALREADDEKESDESIEALMNEHRHRIEMMSVDSVIRKG